MKDCDIIHEDLGYTVSAWNKEQAVHIERMKTNKEVVSRLFSSRYGRSIIMRKHKDIASHDAFWQRAKRHDIHLLARKVIEKFRESIERTAPLYIKNNGKPTSQITQGVKNKQTPRSSGNEFTREKGFEIKYKLPSIKNSDRYSSVENVSQRSLVVNKHGKMLGRHPSTSSLEDKLKNHYQEKCQIDDYLHNYMRSNNPDNQVDEDIFNPPPSPDVEYGGNHNCWTENSVSADYDQRQSNRRKIVVTLPNIYSDSETHQIHNSNIDIEKLNIRPASEKGHVSQLQSNSKKGKHYTSRNVISSSTPTRFIPKRRNEASNGTYRFDTDISTTLARQRLQGLPPLQISFHSKVNVPVKYVFNNQNIVSKSEDNNIVDDFKSDTDRTKSPDSTFQIIPKSKSSSVKLHKASIPLARKEGDQDNLSVIGVNPNVPLNFNDERRTSMSSQSSKSSKDSVGNRLNVIILNRKRARQKNKRNIQEDDVSKLKEEKLVDQYRNIACSGLSQKEKSRRMKVIKSDVYGREKLKVTEAFGKIKEAKNQNLQPVSTSEEFKYLSRQSNPELPQKPSHMSEFVFRVYMRQKELQNEGMPKVHRSVEQNKYLRHCGPLVTDAQINSRYKSSTCSDEFRQKIMLDTLNRKTINL